MGGIRTGAPDKDVGAAEGGEEARPASTIITEPSAPVIDSLRRKVTAISILLWARRPGGNLKTIVPAGALGRKNRVSPNPLSSVTRIQPSALAFSKRCLCDMDRLPSRIPENLRQSRREVFIDEILQRSGGAIAMLGDLFLCESDTGEDIVPRDPIFLRDLVGRHSGRELVENEVDGDTGPQNDGPARPNLGIHADSFRDLTHACHSILSQAGFP